MNQKKTAKTAGALTAPVAESRVASRVDVEHQEFNVVSLSGDRRAAQADVVAQLQRSVLCPLVASFNGSLGESQDLRGLTHPYHPKQGLLSRQSPWPKGQRDKGLIIL